MQENNKVVQLKVPKAGLLIWLYGQEDIGPLNNKQVRLLCSSLPKNSGTVTTSKIQPSSNKYPFTNETWT